MKLRCNAAVNAASHSCLGARDRDVVGLVLVVLLLAGAAWAQELPNAPQVQPVHYKTWEAKAGKPAGFFTYRGHWQDPPLRTNAQTFKAKAAMASYFVAFAAMTVACSRKNSREEWHSELPAMLAVGGGGYVSARYFSESWVPLEMGFAAVHYSMAAAR